MIIRYVLPLVALGLLVFAVAHVLSTQPDEQPVSPPVEPASSPFGNSVAGAGIIEAQTQNIAVGSPVPGVVTEVFVVVGQNVKAGDPLFRLDERELQSRLKVQQAALAAAEAELKRLENQPRAEQIPVQEAQVRGAEALLEQARDAYRRVRSLIETRAATEEELISRQQTLAAAEASLAEAKAQLALLKAGAWEFDKQIARTAVEQARAQLEAVRTDLDRLSVRALVDGEVLQVNVRPGEFVGAPASQALVVLGNVHKLHVRVDIDEHDIPRFEPGAEAIAMLRGNPNVKFPLKFVRVEPYVIPKRSLTGSNTERVDTRVLQVIYALEPGDKALYVGQQLDVVIQAGSEPEAEVTPPPVAATAPENRAVPE